ncbi:MATE family efflux transporter [Scytonema sp. NUACC26]|uniref:MATE family efflux transporter n=1 Tax=Scytonema sp. NUACC26 TaxID=3140176 RepID=UPI0038B25866
MRSSDSWRENDRCCLVIIAHAKRGFSGTYRVSRITAQGLWLAAAVSLPAMLLLWNCDSILSALGQQESTVVLTKSYLHAIVWGFPAMVGSEILFNTNFL